MAKGTRKTKAATKAKPRTTMKGLTIKVPAALAKKVDGYLTKQNVKGGFNRFAVNALKNAIT